jgi:hypothetical protein
LTDMRDEGLAVELEAPITEDRLAAVEVAAAGERAVLTEALGEAELVEAVGRWLDAVELAGLAVIDALDSLGALLVLVVGFLTVPAVGVRFGESGLPAAATGRRAGAAVVELAVVFLSSESDAAWRAVVVDDVDDVVVLRTVVGARVGGSFIGRVPVGDALDAVFAVVEAVDPGLRAAPVTVVFFTGGLELASGSGDEGLESRVDISAGESSWREISTSTSEDMI